MAKKDNAGKTPWDLIDEIRPKNLKSFHWIFIFLAASTLTAIFSGNDDGNMFFYFRLLATRLYQDQNIFVAVLIGLCFFFIVLFCASQYYIHEVYKPEIERLKGNVSANTKKGQQKSRQSTAEIDV